MNSNTIADLKKKLILRILKRLHRTCLIQEGEEQPMYIQKKATEKRCEGELQGQEQLSQMVHVKMILKSTKKAKKCTTLIFLQ